MKRKYCYCNWCGSKNKIDDKECLKCGKRIRIKASPLSDYLLDQAKDDIKGNILDNVFDKIKYLIKKYAYGMVITITVIGGVLTNAIIRTEEEVVTERPQISFSSKEYKRIEDIYNDLVKYMKNGDSLAIKSLLFQTYYPEEALNLGVDASDNIIFDLTKVGVFKNNYNEINEFRAEEVLLLEDKRYVKPREKKEIDLSSTDYYVYNYYLVSGHYIDEDAEKKWMGKNDFELFFILADGHFYLLDLYDNHYDKRIYEANGDLSLLDYEKQDCYYVFSEEECNERFGGN